LVATLRQYPGFDVFYEDDPSEAPSRAADVVITDYDHALNLVRRPHGASAGSPGDVRILAVTPNDRETDIRRAIEAGVYGYFLVGGPLEELVNGVKVVAHGLRYMSPSVAHRMAESLTRTSLTYREIEILRLVAAGHANKTIARHLSIELDTVKSHVSALLAKLGACSRTQAARIAVARGLVDEPDLPEPPQMPVRRRAPQTLRQQHVAAAP